VIFQEFPGSGILKKKSRTFQEAWEPCNTDRIIKLQASLRGFLSQMHGYGSDSQLILPYIKTQDIHSLFINNGQRPLKFISPLAMNTLVF